MSEASRSDWVYPGLVLRFMQSKNTRWNSRVGQGGQGQGQGGGQGGQGQARQGGQGQARQGKEGKSNWVLCIQRTQDGTQEEDKQERTLDNGRGGAWSKVSSRNLAQRGGGVLLNPKTLLRLCN